MSTQPANAGVGTTAELSINGDVIKARDVWEGHQNDLAAKAGSMSPAGFRSYVERLSAQRLEDLIAEALLYQRARLRLSEDHQKKIDELVEADIRKIVAVEYGGVQRRFEKSLESKGQSLTHVRNLMQRRSTILAYMEQHVRPKLAEPTRAELWKLFQANADSLRRPPRRKMSLVHVRATARLATNTQNPTAEEVEAARAEALFRVQAAHAALLGGAAFDQVARQYSDGLHADEGGAWGWVTPGSVREQFEPALEALGQLEPGQVSGVIAVSDGYFIVRCDEVDPGREPDFQSMQAQILQQWLQNAYNHQLADLVAELRANADLDAAELDRFRDAVVAAAFSLTSTPQP